MYRPNPRQNDGQPTLPTDIAKEASGETRIMRLRSWVLAYMIKDPLAFMRVMFLMRSLTHTSRALDAGCGMGGLTLVLATRATHVIGVNMTEADIATATARARRLGFTNVQFVVCDLREIGKQAVHIGLFDTIVLFDVIEHIRDDRTLVRQLYTLLNPGGQLLITSPHLGTRHFPGERISESEDGGHVRWGYSTEDMVTLCTQAGFRVEKIETFGGPVTYALVYAKRALERNALMKLLGEGMVFLLRPLQLMDATLIKLTSYVPYQVGAVARKVPEGRSG